MTKQEQIKTPELNKLLTVKDNSQTIREFLEWLTMQVEPEIVLAKTGEWECDCCGNTEEVLLPITQTTEQILAEYFKIDLTKCEQERGALLAAVREDNK